MKIAFGLAASAAAFAFAAPATAAETLQVVSGSGARAAQIQAFGPVGQSFTAFTDTITSVGFQFNTLNPGSANAPITFNLFAGETLTGPSLFTGSFALPAAWTDRTPRWADIVLPGVAVTNGSVYSLVLSTTSSRTGIVLGPDYNIFTGQPLGPDAYVGGRAFANRTLFTNCSGANNNCDLNFRVTGENLIAAAVPEPGTWALLILGFGAVGGALRRRNTRRPVLIYS